jgi:hypothetical protein
MAGVMLVNECCGRLRHAIEEFLHRECPADALQRMAVTGQPGTGLCRSDAMRWPV